MRSSASKCLHFFGQIHIIKWEVTLTGKLIKHNHDRHKASPVYTEYHCHIPSIITRTYAALLDTLANGQHARLTNWLFLESTHKSRPYIFGSALLFVNYIFFQQKCKFSNQIQKHDFDNSIKSWGITVTLMCQIFSKSTILKVPELTAPLSDVQHIYISVISVELLSDPTDMHNWSVVYNK